MVTLSGCTFRLSAGSGVELPSDDEDPGTPENAVVTPEAYFSSTLKPMFEANCKDCHNEPRFGGSGPLTIFSYNAMVIKLMNGATAESNELMKKVRGEIAHDGGDQCKADAFQSPCLEIQAWYLSESAARGGGRNASPLGRVVDVSGRGVVSGWAVDFEDPNDPVEIELYLDGPKGTGTFLGKVSADKANPPSGFSGNHGFQYSIPAQYRDGANRMLYIYALDTDSKEQSAVSQPLAFRLFAPGAQAFFDKTVKPALQLKCISCHAVFVDYEVTFYDYLSNPLPGKGGSATGNYIHQKGSNTIPHGQGDVCNGGSPCTEIERWWRCEFENICD